MPTIEGKEVAAFGNYVVREAYYVYQPGVMERVTIAHGAGEQAISGSFKSGPYSLHLLGSYIDGENWSFRIKNTDDDHQLGVTFSVVFVKI